jgi:hypothetical protein
MAQPDAPIVGETLEEKVRRLEAQVRDLRQHDALWPGSFLRRLLPPEARKHLRAAQRERLLAVRAVLDSAIQRTEDAPPPRRPESLRIE